jgi:tetratricopeptide (TPR) repeat protein
MIRVLLFLIATSWTIVITAQELSLESSKAKSAYLQEKYFEAISFAEQCLDMDSLNLDCIQVYADAANKLGDQSNAKKYYHKLEKLDSNNVRSYIQLATIYEQQQRIPRAIKYYYILNKLLPDNPIYYRKNAQLFRTVKDTKEAFRLYALANKLNPRDILTLKGLAEICIMNDQMLMADSLIQCGLAVDDENISMHYLSAISKYKQKQYDSVTVILEGLRGQVDLDSYYNKLLGFSYLQIDSIDLAIQKLQLALVDEPDSEKLHFYLATAFEKKEQLEGALEHFEKAVEFGRSPDLDLYHRNVARIANNEKKYKKAIENYKDAYKYGHDPVILYYLATISDTYYKDKSIAINYYKKYIKSGHNHVEYIKYAKSRSTYLKEQRHQSQ